MAGELKHGPLALVDEHMPVMLIMPVDENYTKCQNALAQISARGNKPIIVGNVGDDNIPAHLEKILVPKSVDCLQGILTVIPLQLISYHLAVAQNFNVCQSEKTRISNHNHHVIQVDQPRHLAKSVTVE